MFPLHVLKDELRQRNKVMQSYFLDFGLRISVSNVSVCPIMLANTCKMLGRRMCILLLQLRDALEKTMGERLEYIVRS